MRAVALHLEGPLQSWGGPTAGDDRPSWDIPSKSGVLGLVAASLGIDRASERTLTELHRGLQLGIRVDATGSRGLDFHTAQEVPSGERNAKSVVSRRTYLQDAAFTALLVETVPNSERLEEIVSALRYPAYVQYLGRKACVPSAPVCACREVIQGMDWLSLFAAVPAPSARKPGTTILVEGALADELTVRRVRMRDERCGPLPRMFQERVVHQLRTDVVAAGKDTVTPWFPA